MGGVHQFAALNEQLAEQGLAAGIFAPLECHDGQVRAADVFPVGDLPGIDVPELLLGEALDGIFFVDDEHQCIPANGFLVQRAALRGHFLLDGFRGLVGDDELGGIALIAAVKAQVPPGPGRGVGAHAALGRFQIHARGVRHDLRNEGGDAGRAAVGHGKLVGCQDGLTGHFTGSIRAGSGFPLGLRGSGPGVDGGIRVAGREQGG